MHVVALSEHSLTEQLATLVHDCPPKAQVPAVFRGQSVSTEQVCDVVWFEAFRHIPYAGQLFPRLQFAPPYWQRGTDEHVRDGLHDAPPTVQFPVVTSGQSPLEKHAAYWQLRPRLSQVCWVHCPACGAQSAEDAHDIPSS